VTLAEHGGMAILGEENRELTLGYSIEALGNISKELNILCLIKIGLRSEAILLLALAKYLGRTSQQQLNVDILAVKLKASLRNLTQIHLLNHHEDVITIDVVTTARE
jgi:hypothetical protein